MNSEQSQAVNPANKNICLIIDTLIGGGAERMVITLATVLSKLGHRVDVIIFHNRIHYSLDERNFNLHIIDRQHRFQFLRRYTGVKNLRKKLAELNVEFDLVVANSHSVNKICKWAKLPNLYFCIHSTISVSIFNRYKNRKGWRKFSGKISRSARSFLIKKLYNKQKIITVSAGVAKDLLDFNIRPKSAQTIYNPIHFENARKQAQKHDAEEDNYIIHVGSFSSQKRHDILIKAYHQSGIDEKLLLLGDHINPTGERMQQLATDLNLQDKIIFKGFNQNPYPYIKNAKALILSSDNEGLAMVLIEALVLGVPIVSTDCPSGPREIMTGELSKFLSPVGDVDALAVNIRKMLKTPVEITEDYISRFEAEKIAKQYLALCRDD